MNMYQWGLEDVRGNDAGSGTFDTFRAFADSYLVADYTTEKDEE